MRALSGKSCDCLLTVSKFIQLFYKFFRDYPSIVHVGYTGVLF